MAPPALDGQPPQSAAQKIGVGAREDSRKKRQLVLTTISHRQQQATKLGNTRGVVGGGATGRTLLRACGEQLGCCCSKIGGR